MGAQPDEDEDLNLDLEDEQADPGNQDDDGEGDQSDADDDASEGDDDFEVSFDGEEAPQRGSDSDLVKRLRAEVKEARREAAEAKRAAPPPVIEVVDPGPKPTMDDCWDAPDPSAEFEKRLLAWHEKVAESKAAETAAQQREAKKQEAFRVDLDRFAKHRDDMKAPDFEDAETAVAAALTREQASALLQATENSAKVIYALGKHPERLKALAGETNIVKFIAQAVKLEGSVKVTSRRQAPAPDRTVRGSAPFSGSSDKREQQLEKEADKTGDRTKLIQYRRERRERSAAK